MELFRTDAKHRDEGWKDRLNAAFWPARLGSFTQYVMQNDVTGHFCYRLGRDENDGGEAAIESAGIVDYAIEKGIGLILWPSDEPQPIWEFRLGDVLSYRLYGTCFAPRFWNEPPDTQGGEILQEREEVLLGQPNDEMFPPIVRHAVRRYMREKLGIREPKVTLMQRPNRGSRLVFELREDEVGGADKAFAAFNRIAWLIPDCIPLYHMPSMAGSSAMMPI